MSTELLDLLSRLRDRSARYAKNLSKNGEESAAIAIEAVSAIFAQEAMRIEHPDLVKHKEIACNLGSPLNSWTKTLQKWLQTSIPKEDEPMRKPKKPDNRVR